ncbi:DNA-binding transcriptional LysR family regulator [Erwinia toletana]|uniref:DNA-binding transcriptional LysR family regulator n=1 Tax=Winslowiella toletana TaxID=92490 RepID=A0ABS4PDP7_9GAMM|nr:LysR family transcriptional regulator [Winslowiella toletana]MBP2170768.1 DNA-binding transcriptional LysR family regulator [Winslowiella toletana]
MARDNLNDLVAFVTVAREQSFTRAAAQLGVSQSALSHTMRSLEAKMGVRLLTRTTRSVSPTEIGEQLLVSLAPKFDDIYSELAALHDQREQPAGTIRISATDFAIETILWPKLSPLMRAYPDINIEFVNDYGLTDIVEKRYDAGVRLGGQLANGMISAKIGPDMRFLVVGSPTYFAENPLPASPQDLLRHRCINLRLPTHGGFYVWEFEKDGREVTARVEGQIIFHSIFQIVKAAVAGFGLGHVPEELAAPYIKSGQLISVMEEWTPYWEGLHIYYPNRRGSSKAFSLVVEALRYRN